MTARLLLRLGLAGILGAAGATVARAAEPRPVGAAQPDPASGRAQPAATAAPGRPVSALHEGYRRYQGVCGHCHGPDGAGSSFAPSLVEPLPAHDRFVEVVREGVSGQGGGMRGFAGDPNVEPYLEAIYAYLAARAAGRIGRGRPDDAAAGR
jgi:mono/diheme cytochrome c family protein